VAFGRRTVKCIEVVGYLMFALGGVRILMSQHGVLARKADKPSAAMKWIGLALLLGGLAKLAQTLL